MSSGTATGSPSRAPSGFMYAQLCSRSTTPDSSCSAPIGSWIAIQRSESCSCTDPSTRKKSARSRSSMFTKTTRESSSSSARFHTRVVLTSTPITPETTTSAPSTTFRLAIVSAWKPESPGVSIRLIFRPCHSRFSSEAASDICRLCSSSSQSETVLPASTVPRRLILPAWKSIASTSEVLPVPRWPTTATLRIFPGSCGIPSLLSVDQMALRPTNPNPSSEARSGSAGAGEARLEPQHGLRVQLRHARLGHAEHLADLAQGQLLVVVERDHDLLALGKARDRV